MFTNTFIFSFFFFFLLKAPKARIYTGHTYGFLRDILMLV